MRLEGMGISVRYPASRRDALRGVDVAVAQGELVLVVGPSGSGKSTLLMILAALLEPSSGRVTADGADVFSGDLVRFRRSLGVVFQSPERQLFASTVADEVAFGPRQQGLAEDEVALRVSRALEQVGLPTDMSRRSPFTLSGGEQRRVALASALAMEPSILLLDEPMAGLDPAGRMAFEELVVDLVRAGRGALVVSHDPAGLLSAADRVYVFEEGRVAWAGAASRLRLHPDEARRLGIEPSLEEVVAAELRKRGLPLEDRRWDVGSLARLMVEGPR